MSSFEQQKDTFARLVPDLERMAAAKFRRLDPAAREEAVQNTLVLTWKAYHALIAQGRAGDPGIIGSCLFFAIKQTRVGRRAEGEARSKDAFRYAERGRVRFEWVDPANFVSDATPVPEAVAFRIDVPAFLATLTPRQRRMAGDLMAGFTTTECAVKYGRTEGAVSQFRRRFKTLFDSFVAG